MADQSHSFDAYFKRATSPLATLSLLSEKTMYGYEICATMRERSGGRFTMNILYPVLYRLEEQGYIVVSHTEVIKNRARSYYAITEAGRAYLDKSLREYREISAAFNAIIRENVGE